MDPLEDAGVLVGLRDGKGIIERVDRTIEPPEGYRRIDLDGRYLLPGLINAHAHIMDFYPDDPIDPDGEFTPQSHISDTLANIREELASGVTTLRTMGEWSSAVVHLKEEIDQGMVQGPRLLVSGPGISPTNGHGWRYSLVADGPWEFRREVRLALSRGVDWIKLKTTGGVTDSSSPGDSIAPRMIPEEIRAACDEAHRAGRPVASHTLGRRGLREALEAGVDTVEHGSAIDPDLVDLFLDNPRSLRGESALVVTLTVGHNIMRGKAEAEHMNEVQLENARQVWEEELEGLKTALDRGIPLGCGNDVLGPFNTHDTFWEEVVHLAHYGDIPNRRALQIATLGNARVLGVDGVTGTVEPGKEADLMVLDRDPLKDLSALARPAMVFARGREVPPGFRG
ncbi:MAG: amidohydrolase family protein [Methanomassiliicoccales archaeon]